MPEVSEMRKMSAALRSAGATLALAESCTGGLIGSEITEISGASDFFLGSAVVYSNVSKSRILGVKPETLEKFGAVSEETALEMASGALSAFNSDFAASVTGIAGPGGAVPDKPVGTVCIAVTDGRRTIAFTKHFTGDRSEVRKQSADTVFGILSDFVKGRI